MSDKKVLIVDDESLARDRIRRFITELKLSFQIDEARNGIEALEKISARKPDIVFLDVQMPGLSGFEVLQQLERRDFHLIFQTAFDEHAIQAFDENACDYLLKPFSLERFKKAMLRVTDVQAQSASLKNLEHALQKKIGFIDRIAVKQTGKTRIVDLNAVDCFISRDHYTCIYSGSEELVSELSLSWLEERIDPARFVRCHRNNIVSLPQIKVIGGTNDSEIQLKNGMKVPLSRNNRKKVLEFYLSQS